MDMWLPLLRELGSLALVAVIILYLVRDYLPKQTERFLEQLADQRRDFSKALESQLELSERHLRQRTELEDARYARLTDCLRRLADTAERQMRHGNDTATARGQDDA